MGTKANECHEVTFLGGEECLYSVVKRSAVSLGWKVIGEEASDKVKRDCHVIWVDKSFANDKRFLSIQPWQRINHFPGMTNICRKIRLAQSLELMKKKFPREYSFFPTTYILPLNLAAFRSLFHNGQSTSTYIVKPDGSAQGKGIFLTKRIEDVENLNTMCVAQQYIKNPLLIDKKKFDLRIYVLVTSCCPLRIYLFRDGLVRMCTEEYKHPTDRNLRDKCMHLTNYSINKRSDKYQRDRKDSTPSNTGNKRTISWLLNWLSRERGEAAANDLWAKIGDICVMTILSILPTLRREYDTVFGKTKLPVNNEGQESNKNGSSGNRTIEKSRCFELLGVDIMIDTKLNPILIEVNHLPSWGTDSSVDELIKSRVIVQALSAINVKLHEKKAYERARRKQSRLRLRKMRQPVDGDSAQDGDDIPIKSDIATKRKRADLFDSNSAERKIRTIYEKYAPEKLPHVKDLINKYRGYEEWLVMRVEEKYVHSTDDDSSNSCCANGESDDDGDDDVTSSDESGEEEEEDCIIEESEREILLEEDRILEDYDRIYPPKGNCRISLSRYKEMEQFVSDSDEERQRRLTCPLHEMRSNNCQVENEFGTHGSLNRGEGWIGGNVHLRQNRQEPKVFAPPTKQQIECASRLFQGFSVEDTEITTRSLNRKSRLLHHNLIDLEESNPLYHLIDRVREARELSKQARDRAEKRLSHRGIKGSTSSVRGQNLDLAVDLPIVAARNVFAPSVRLK